MKETKNLKTFLKRGKNLAFVGAHNPFIAKLIESSGFGGVYLSGAGLSNSMGMPDTGILKLADFARMGELISMATSLPVLSDADTGFNNVAETVEAYIKAGISGLHIEDQVFPKRCGHLDGKEVVSTKDMVQKIEEAVKRRDALDKDFMIIARTDARGATNVKEGSQFEEALARGQAYISAGADAVFPESMRSKEELEKYRAAVRGVLLANMTEFGKTPFIKYEELFRLGYQMVIFPVTLFRALAGEAKRAIETLKKEGHQESLVNNMMTRGDVNKLLNYDPKK